MIELPKGILIPSVILLSVVGTYALKNSLTDVYWMLGFGVVGYLLKKYGYQVGPIILGVILGPIVDESARQALMSCRNSIPAFLYDLVSNPITLVLTIAVVFMFLSQTSDYLINHTAIQGKEEQLGSKNRKQGLVRQTEILSAGFERLEDKAFIDLGGCHARYSGQPFREIP